MDTKLCSKCKQRRPLTRFGKSTYTRDGLQSWCKPCKAKLTLEYQKAHPEEKRAKDRAYYQRHKAAIRARRRPIEKANREKIRESARARAPRYREKARLAAAAWHAANKERASATTKISGPRWRHANPDKVAAIKSRRRAREVAANGDFTGAEFRALCKHYGNKCLMCKRTDVKLTPDHVIPLSLGGSNSIDNIQPLCSKCNCKKFTKILDLR